MKKALSLLVATLLVGAGGMAFADDGAITNKSMSRTIEPPEIDYGQDIVNAAVREDEHAFTDMMGFYVPAQAASGEVLDSIAYCDIDNTPAPGEDCTNAVEELEVAKPLINVFIHGPAFGRNLPCAAPTSSSGAPMPRLIANRASPPRK